MFIPVYRHPHTDEHIYGWIQDLARLNGMTFRKFSDYFLGGMAWDGTIDSVAGMSCLEDREDLRSLIFNNTLIPAVAPYMEQYQQAACVDHLLTGGHKHIYHTSTYMKVCPCCVNEDTEKGIRPYYRVWHQLDEITTCAVHGTWLLRLKKHGPLDEKTLMSAELETEDCGDIAKKVFALYQEPAMTDCTAWHCRMTKRERRVSRAERIMSSELGWLREAEKKKLLAEVHCAVCGNLYLSHPYVEGRYNVCRTCRIKLGTEGTEQAVWKIRRDYKLIDGAVVHLSCGKKIGAGSPQAFLWSGRECGCKSAKGSLKIHKRTFDDGEFTVIDYLKGEKDGKRLIRVRHSVCGEEFLVKPGYFSTHRYCSVCRQRALAVRFMHDLHGMLGEEYEVQTPEDEITSTRSSVSMRHRYCGEVFSNTARNILGGQRCPFCTAKMGPGKVIALLKDCFVLDGIRIEPSGNGMVSIRYPDGTSRRERPALLVQEMTRLDEPNLLTGRRFKRLSPDKFYSPKARLFAYYRENNENSLFQASCRSADSLGMNQSEYWCGLSYLEKQGKIAKTGKRGIYRLISGDVYDETKDCDPGHVRAV